MAYQFRLGAAPGERFAPGAFDRLIGAVVPQRFREYEGGPVLAELGQVRLAGARVIEDGAAVLLTVEPAGDMPAGPAGDPAAGMSFAAGRFGSGWPAGELPEEWRDDAAPWRFRTVVEDEP